MLPLPIMPGPPDSGGRKRTPPTDINAAIRRGARRSIIQAVGDSHAPFRLLLGSDAIRVVGAELDAERADLESWKDISVTTDFVPNLAFSYFTPFCASGSRG